MAAHSHAQSIENEITRLRPGNRILGIVLMAVGLLALLVAAAVYGFRGGENTQRFFFAYMFGLTGFAMISFAALIFVVVNHLVRAGWITNVRRVLEVLAVQVPLIAILALPIIGTVVYTSLSDPEHPKKILYSWAVPSDTPVVHHGEEHHEDPLNESVHDNKTHAGTTVHGAPSGPVPTTPGPTGGLRTEVGHDIEAQVSDVEHGGHRDDQFDEAGHNKIGYPNAQVQPGVTRDFDPLIEEKNHGWLNPAFWVVRVIIYFVLLSIVAIWYYRSSVRQDATGDVDISETLMKSAGPVVFACGLIITFIAFDVYMALDPHWFSTMYGVYFFASGSQAMWALMCLTFIILKSRGYLAASVTTEHFHDMGKWLWAFIFFFAYIAFSQYMLQWYANLPEETFFFDKRGYSTANPNGYSPLVLALVFGRFCIPFLGLISRHVKRSRFGLGFWAVWLLVFFFVDVYLLVMPEFKYPHTVQEIPFGVPEILCLLGVGALWLGNVIRGLTAVELRPVRDPRAHESLAYANF